MFQSKWLRTGRPIKYLEQHFSVGYVMLTAPIPALVEMNIFKIKCQQRIKKHNMYIKLH